MSIKVEKKAYKNFGECVFLDNGTVSLGITTEIGPRIIYFARSGRENVIFEDTARRFTDTAKGYGTWYNYGGHRLWVAPELNPETYSPDNSPVKCEINGSSVTVTPPATPFGKELSFTVTLDEEKPVVTLTSRIKNISDKDSEFALWSITCLTSGGVCRIPMNTARTGYLPNRVISLWDYSDVADSRFKLTDSEARIRQDPFVNKAFKAGFNVEDGFIAYFVNKQVFVKCIPPYENVCYPDYSCNVEVYTNDGFIECEVLGEKKVYAPGTETVLTENWCLLDNEDNYESADLRADIGEKIKALL